MRPNSLFDKLGIILIILFFGIALIFSLTQISFSPQEIDTNPAPARNSDFTKPFVLKNTHLFIDIAESKSDQIQGLSGQASLADNQGLLFVFPSPGLYAIWMKDMLFPIDIIWLDESLSITHIEKNVSPDTYPKTFSSEIPSSFVLEVKGGFTDAHSLFVGDQGKFLP